MYKSSLAFKRAQKYIPGGVNSPVRSFQNVGGSPLFIEMGKGAKIYSVDGNEYLDYCMSWGALIAGHAHADVVKDIRKIVKRGTSFGAPTNLETELAKMIIEYVPSIEKIRFVNSGTEAVMSALRLARAYTNKKKIIKFDGCYHGHTDQLLIASGSGLATFRTVSSHGVLDEFIQETISLPFNDEEAVREAFNLYKDDIAAVIVEPVPANMGVILPKKGYLEFLRNITAHHNVLLIFDEVITGFRIDIGGAQEYFNITPDITCLGKIIGGGFPVGAYGGKEEIMSLIAPIGSVYQAGTLSGNPVAMSAGIATLTLLRQRDFYTQLMSQTKKFAEAVNGIIRDNHIKVNFFGSVFTIFFTDTHPEGFATVKKCDTQRFARFYKKMLEEGIYFSPSQFEANFISIAHTDKDLTKTVTALQKVLKHV